MAPDCPPQDALRRYLIGDYSDEQGADIERHLSECAACEDTLAGFDDTKDLLLRHLPLAAAATNDVEPSASSSRPAWLDRLKAGLPAAASESLSDDNQPAGANPIGGLDSYELLGILGRGGMGVVYHARHRQLGRDVAIKVVHPKLTSALNVRDRFEQEIRILGGMNHPGIVMATDAGRVGPAAYLVMELIEGIDLARLVREQGPLSIAQATELARQVAEALAAAHSSNAIHRDVKPSNVMLDRDGRAKLLDFGLAHLSERANKHHETSLGHVLGTLDYMAPEQAEGNTVQPSTDLYGLGALLFYLLTGEPPHGTSPDRTLLQQLKSITSADARPLTSVRADVPDDLSQLVAQLLDRDPAQRPNDASQIAKSLSAWAASDSLAALTETIEPQRQTDDKDAVDRSLCALLGVEATADLTGQAATATERPHAEPRTAERMFRNLGVATAIAAGIGAILFGITLLLDTPTGKIQINSVIAGVQVELVDEKDRVRKLTVENMQQTTELKVGKYRVRILEPHDGMTLDKNTLTLKKGETTVATISQSTNELQAPGVQIPSTAPSAPTSADVAVFQSFPEAPYEYRFNPKEVVFYISDSDNPSGEVVFRGDDVRAVSMSKTGEDPTFISIGLVARKGYPKTIRAFGKRMVILSAGEFVAAANIRGVQVAGNAPQFAMEGKFTQAEHAKVMGLFSQLNTQHAEPAKSVQEPILPLRMVEASELEFYILDPETDARIGDPVIRGEDILSVEANKQPDNSTTSIEINLNPDAGEKLREVTSKNIGKRMAIVFEGKQLSAPTIHSAISSRCAITGNFSDEEIERLLAPFLNDASKKQLGDGSPEPLYEGHPQSFWVERFAVEKNPAAKIAAGEALLSFVSGSTDEQVEQRVRILGRLYEAAYGKKLQDAAFALCADTDMPQSIWPNAKSLSRMRRSVERQLAALPSDEVAAKLVEMAASPSPKTCSYTLIAFSVYTAAPDSFADAILDDLGSNPAATEKLRLSILMMRARIFSVASDEQKKRIVTEMELAGRERVAMDVAAMQPNATEKQRAAAGRDRSFERVWLDRIRKWKNHGWVSSDHEKTRVKAVKSKIVSEVVLYELLNNDGAFAKHFYRYWATDSSPFQASIISINRDRSFPIWEDWVNVANEWLAENNTPENQASVNRVLKTFRLVLPTRMEKDDWDVKATAAVMTKHLKSYYAATEPPRDGSVDAHDLLNNLILCGGSFPDFVMANPPADPEIRKRLADFREVVNSDLSYDEYVRRSTAAKGLIQVAPYHTIKCIMTATKPPRGVDRMRLIKDASNIKTEVYHAIGSTSHIPPINPLLLLAITSELSKEYGNTIDYRALKSDEKLFQRHLRDALRCPTAVGPIASRWYAEMAGSLSDEKRKELQVLAPIPSDVGAAESPEAGESLSDGSAPLLRP